jgi:SAM-dependent methyltransferase
MSSRSFVLSGLSLLLAASSVLAADLQPTKNAGPFIPSPEAAVAAMLQYAKVGPNDFIIDLGSGDGRIVRTAAKLFGARGFGVEIKEDLVRSSNEAAQKEGLADRVKFIKQDLFKTDISQATVLTMYLLPDTVNLLREKLLRELKPGTRIVSHDYPLTGWIPEDMKQFDLPEKVDISGVQTTIVWLYLVPAKVAGRWSAKMPPAVSRAPATLELKQQLTRVSGTAHLDGKETSLEDVKLRGEHLSFRLTGRKGEFTGLVKGKSIEGTVDAGGARAPWSATLGG